MSKLSFWGLEFTLWLELLGIVIFYSLLFAVAAYGFANLLLFIGVIHG